LADVFARVVGDGECGRVVVPAGEEAVNGPPARPPAGATPVPRVNLLADVGEEAVEAVAGG
jgi:hypothetical protein